MFLRLKTYSFYFLLQVLITKKELVVFDRMEFLPRPAKVLLLEKIRGSVDSVDVFYAL